MSTSTDTEELQGMITAALQAPEFEAQLATLEPRHVQRIAEQVLAEGDLLWGTVARERQYLSDLEGKKKEIDAQLAAVPEVLPRWMRFARGVKEFVPLLPTLLIIAYVVLGFSVGWGTPWHWIGQLTNLAVCAAVVLPMVLLLVLHTHRMPAFVAARQAVVQRRAVELGEADLSTKLAQAQQDVAKAMQNRVLRAVASAISSKVTPHYDVTLKLTASPGIDAAYDPQREVITPAHRRLRFMLKNMRGGSIGIAGPRGAGKSTLLGSVCLDSITHIEGKQVLTVATSAPVEYEGREFLLHLFATVCHRALERLDKQHTRFMWQEDPTALRRVGREWLQWGLRLGQIGLGVGLVCMVLGLLLAGIAAESKSEAKSKPVAGQKAAPAAASRQPPAASPQPAATTAKAKPAEDVDGTWLLAFVGALGISAAGLMAVGGWLALLGAAVLGLCVARAKPFVNAEADARLARGSVGGRPAGADDPRNVTPGFPLNVLRRIRLASTALSQPALEPSRVERDARAWLTEIKFQQSYTSGWSGSMKVGIGEGSLNRARSLAQQQLTLPEVVDGFVRFLRLLALDYTVIIGIDELDKLESDDSAQKFLNEIKAIFGLVNVFYLITVSENAMSAFERRGLPFRDVFDSSFDELISVEYLSLDASRRLLAERLVGMPQQFVALCYCLSGGLARELVRVCRDLVEYMSSDESGDLESVSRSLVATDLRSKTRAMMFSAQKLSAAPLRDALLSQLHTLETLPVEPYALDGARSQLTQRLEAARKDKAHVGGVEANAVSSIECELKAYLCYLALVLRIFVNALDESAFGQSAKQFDDLVDGLRALSVNHGLAEMLFSGLESKHSPSPARAVALQKEGRTEQQ